MDEIQRYFAGQIAFEDLSQMAKLFVTTLRAGDVRSIHAGLGIVDRTSEQDIAGPFTRITWTIESSMAMPSDNSTSSSSIHGFSPRHFRPGR